MVKKVSILIGLIVIGLCGCQQSQRSQQSAGLPVEIKNGKDFPQELVGTWICSQNKWRIVLEENGSVTWAMHPMGSAWIEPGKKLELPAKMNRISTYAPGAWNAAYDYEGSILSIDIIIPFFEIAMGPDTLTGDSTDFFTGPVDLNNGIWEPDWFSVATYILNTDELKDHSLETGGPPEKGKVVFKRFEIDYEK